MPARPPSPFLARPRSHGLAWNDLASAIPDAYSASPGHNLVGRSLVFLVLIPWLAFAPHAGAAAPVPAGDLRGAIDAAARETSLVVLARLVSQTPGGAAPAISTDHELETITRLAELPGAASVSRFTIRTFGGRAGDKIISYGGQPELTAGQSHVVLLRPGPAGSWVPAGALGSSVFPVIAGPTGLAEVRLLEGPAVVITNGKLELADHRAGAPDVRPGATPEELARWVLPRSAPAVASQTRARILRVSGLEPTVARQWLDGSVADLARCGRDALARGAPSPLLLRCSAERSGAGAVLRVACSPGDDATGFAGCVRDRLSRRELPGSGPVSLELELGSP